MPFRHYYLLEHPRRGVVTALPGEVDDKFHFQWSKPRGWVGNKRMTLERARLFLPHAPLGTVIIESETWRQRS